MSELNRVVRYISETPWAVLPSVLATIVEIVRLRASGARLIAEEIEARIAGGPAPVTPAPASPAIAVLPIHGVIVPRAGMFSDVSGATSAEGLMGRFNSAM